MINICVVSVFKNESHILKEWLEHYIKEEVDIFFLTDNGSTDDYLPILEPYINSGKVVLNVNPKKYAQVEHLNFFLKKAKTYDWVIPIDLDEFVYARNGYNTIKEYLKDVKSDVHKIYIPWKLFGSSGHIKQPASVIQGFIHRRKFPKATCHTCYDMLVDKKTIVRGKWLKKIGVHNSITEETHIITPDNNDIMIDDFYHTNTEKKLQNSYLHLNHYRIQSVESFKKRINRGDAVKKKLNTVRNKKYFNFFDFKDMTDKELRNKTYKKR